jgi:ABC-type phosphate/phosphonate transport system ATPase subunit
MRAFREARRRDYWRRAHKRKYSPKLTEVKFYGASFFQGLELEIDGGLLSVVGRNGVGKSTLIRALFNFFSCSESNRSKFELPLIDEAEIEVAVDAEDGEQRFHLRGAQAIEEVAEASPIIGYIFDPCSLVPEMQALLCGQENIDELLEGYQPKKYDADLLSMMNFLSSNTYDSIEVFNIEDEFQGFNVLPFFKVMCGGCEYDSRFMGLGELSLFYFCWLIDRINSSAEAGILFVEEPESFLPPMAQNRVAGYLGMLAGEKGIQLILSSHSEHVIKEFMRRNVAIMRRLPAGIRLAQVNNDLEPIRALGLDAPKNGVLFFEDSVAGLLLKALIRGSDVFVTDSFYYNQSGSDGAVAADLKAFPSLGGFCGVGVLDGDCRGRADDFLASGPVCFLPGDLSPEEMLINFVRETPSAELALCLGVAEVRLVSALDAVKGLEHHDYFQELCRALDHEFPAVVGKLCDFWVSRHEREAMQFNDSLKAITAPQH